jgi:hypothetical protein
MAVAAVNLLRCYCHGPAPSGRGRRFDDEFASDTQPAVSADRFEIKKQTVRIVFFGGVSVQLNWPECDLYLDA